MTLTEKLTWLRGARLLNLLNEEELAALASSVPDHRCRRREYVFAAGDEARSIYLHKEGTVLLAGIRCNHAAADAAEFGCGYAAL